MQNKNSNNTNFWISYADLMAGLLFVFILLIGAIIVKYSLLQTESKELEQSLQKEKLALEKNKEALKQKEEKIKNVLTDLASLEDRYKLTKSELKEALLKNQKYEKELEQKNSLIAQNLDKLNLLQENIDKTQERLNITLKEKEELTLSLNQLQELSKQKDEKLDKLLEEVLQKKSLIESFEEKMKTLDDEIKVMTEKLKKSEVLHEKLAKDLESTRQRIKNFTGMKIRIISLLKEKLGNKIEIDPKNGSLRLASNVLFEQGKYELKDEAKVALKNALYDYFQTILENDEINSNIDKIVIEGHTNSKGTYLYNLELSQKRAFSVMDFLLSLDFNKQQKLKNLIVASGRSFLDPIYTKDGVEDSEASRRIEIKLSLKNEEAIKEIANILK